MNKHLPSSYEAVLIHETFGCGLEQCKMIYKNIT
jgi:hypothetical protein